jgi:HPt (histidine-containing phosphotransfer) domain-containing protein
VEKKYNIAYLKDYFDDDLASIVNILKMYVEETPKEINNIESWLHDSNIAPAKAATHKIKTNVSMLGISDGSSFINDMHLMKETDPVTDELLAQFEQFKNSVLTALTEIKQDFLAE